MAPIIDGTNFLGTSFDVLMMFFVTGGVIGFIVALYFLLIKKEPLNSLTFKLILRTLALFVPVSWVGLSVGSNLSEGSLFDTDALYYLGETLLISFFFIVIILSDFVKVLRKEIDQLNKVVTTVARGDLRTPEPFKSASSTDIFFPFYRSFSIMLEQLRDLINNVLKASEQVAGNSEMIAASSSEVSTSSGSISTIMENISSGSQRQVEKVEEASNAEKALQFTIQESFERMNETVDQVAEISEETNLLALNASIEAQRAGDAGKGFAIVANNVRRLSDDTRTYNDLIGDLLFEIEGKVKGGQRGISQSISQIREVSEDMAAAAEEVSASAEEQAATLEEMSAATLELANLAVLLQDSLRKFKID